MEQQAVGRHIRTFYENDRMVGAPEKTGIMPLAMLDLLSRYQEVKKYKSIIFKVSYLEIYNENLKDLLISEGNYRRVM